MSDPSTVNAEMAALGAQVLKTRPAPRPLPRPEPRPEPRPVSLDPQSDAAREAARRDLAEVVEAQRLFTQQMAEYRASLPVRGPHGSTSAVGVHDLFVEHVDTHDAVADPAAMHFPTAARIKARLDVSYHEPARLAVASKRRRARLDGVRADHEGLRREILSSDEAETVRKARAKVASLRVAYEKAQAAVAQAHAEFDRVLTAGEDHQAAEQGVIDAEREVARLGRLVRLVTGRDPSAPDFSWENVPLVKKAEEAYRVSAVATLAFWQTTQAAKSATAEKQARDSLLEAVSDRAIDLEAEQAVQQLLNSHLYASPEPPPVE
jgi:hypothetical protein